MAEIHKVDSYHIRVSDRPEEAHRVLLGLKEAGVNLLACCGFPIGDDKVQIDLVPEHYETFRKATARLGLSLSEHKRAFLIQGGDRVGAMADTFGKLASRGINIVASQAVSAGGGRCGMILWVEAADYERASEAFGF